MIIMAAKVQLWGEPDSEDARSHSTAQKQPSQPLWSETKHQKVSSVTCQVPPVCEHTGSRTCTTIHNLSSVLDHPRDDRGRNLMLHTIDLQLYINKLKHVTASEGGNIPGVPTKFWSDPPNWRWLKSDSCNPTCSTKLPSINLSPKQCSLLRRKGVAAICLHAGYTESSKHALDTVGDVLGEFLSRISKLLRVNMDKSRYQGEGFEAVLEQTLHQCGINGKSSLKSYWNRLESESRRLNEVAKEQLGKLQEPKDRAKEKSFAPLSLYRHKRDSVDLRLPSPWISGTPEAVLEEVPVTGEINLDNVLQTRTPDLSGTGFPSLSDNMQDQSELVSLGFEPPPKKRIRMVSYGNDCLSRLRYFHDRLGSTGFNHFIFDCII